MTATPIPVLGWVCSNCAGLLAWWQPRCSLCGTKAPAQQEYEVEWEPAEETDE